MVEELNNEKTFYRVNELYAITICPDDIRQKVDRGCDNRYNRFRKYINKISERLLLHNVDNYFVIEISEPRGPMKKGYLGPRLHVHGVISFRNRRAIQNFLCKELYNILGYNMVEIDTIKDVKIWQKYIEKQHILPEDRKIGNIMIKSYYGE